MPSCKKFMPVAPQLEIKWRNEDIISGLGCRDDILLRVPKDGPMNTYPHLVALITHEVSHAVFPLEGRHTHGKIFKDIWAILVSELTGTHFEWPKNGNRYYSCDDGWDTIEQFVKESALKCESACAA